VRDIKFQLWSKIAQKMITWDEIIALDKYHLIWREDYPARQYIGRNDKTNKEIYHKDIVRLKADPKDYGGYTGHDYIGVVELNEENCQFYVAGKGDNNFCFDEWEKEEIEVVGNVFDNTDLMEASNE
jgi:uncharacterized phage protein (TIGR01671 family)